MKNFIRSIVAVALISLSQASAGAELKIGFVDQERITRESAPADRASKQLEKEFAPRAQEMQRREAQMKTMQGQLEKDALTMSESDRRAKEQELGRLTLDFQRMQREYREDLNLRRNQELGALFERAKSGKGHHIDIAMVDSMTRFMSPRIVPYLGTGEVPQRTGAKDSVIAVYQAFDTQDKPLTLGLGNDAIWKRFWQAVGQAEKGEDPRHASNADRRGARAEIVADIQSILKTKPRDEWLQLFVQAKVPAGPVNSVEDLAQDPELIARGLLYTADSGGRRVPQVGLGIGIDGSNATYRTPPPKLGEHTEQVLKRSHKKS